jgi:hypothetical protein
VRRNKKPDRVIVLPPGFCQLSGGLDWRQPWKTTDAANSTRDRVPVFLSALRSVTLPGSAAYGRLRISRFNKRSPALAGFHCRAASG